MVDTQRTLTALQTLLADNTSGAISPQDVRDMLVSVYLAYNVKNYGAIGDGSADDVTAIQAAIDACAAAGGGVVYFPTATYKIGAFLVPKPSVSLIGEGLATTIKLANAANCNIFKAAVGVALNNIAVANLILDGNGVNQSDGASRDERSGFYMPDGVSASLNIAFRDVIVTGVRHGAGLRLCNTTGLHLTNVWGTSNGSPGAGFSGADGVWLGSCTNAQIDNYIGSTNTDTGLAMDGCTHCHVTNADCDSNSGQGFALGQGSNYIFYSNCSARANTAGWRIEKFGGSATHNAYMSNCNARSNTVEGVRLQDHIGLYWVGGTITDSPTLVNLVSGNSLILVDNPVGFTTKAVGDATVLNGQTTVVVNHGLSVTPALKHISVRPTNNLGNATKWWISNPTSTQFTINVNQDPGAGTATFSWSADVVSIA